jgi:iron complex outermembrane receptor protein
VPKQHLVNSLAVLLAAASPAVHAQSAVPNADPITTLSTVVVKAAADSTDSNLAGADSANADLAAQRAGTSDSARLLQDVPGLSLYGAGGISSLPAIHGLADDRLRIQVDGMDLMPACPNHMNSTLSYIDPTNVESFTVFAGITPVSVGGDSIGGTIQVKSPAPVFARAGEAPIVKGQIGGFYRSNGDAQGYNFAATLAGEAVSLSYSESNSEAGNYHAARAFKPVAPGTEGGLPIPGDIVGSSAYNGSRNRDIGLALKHDKHLLQLNVSEQTVDFEGFPNQRMDMTANTNTVANLRYKGQFEWGDLEARVYGQDTEHKMDMGVDRYFYGTGMPMDTEATTRGALIQANIVPSENHTIRLGAEFQEYTLYDWWPAVGGSMGPNDFWNIDYGQRDKVDVFAEWEAHLTPAWTSLIGVRGTSVMADAAVVQGYDNGLAALWGDEAAAFNALDRKRTDHNWDLTAMARFTPQETQQYEAGYARKTRSPSLYQRYPWSTQPMAALMNNFVGDGNGYIGNVDLKPEVAHTLSASGNWNDADQQRWGVKATGYYTYVQDFIDARRCDFGQCSAGNVTTTTGFVLLQYVNQDAQLHGLDLSGHLLLGSSEDFGSFTGTGLLNYVRGKNRTTHDNLYNIMPLNLKLALVQRLGGWTNTAEVQWVADKKHISQVRNEMQTDSYTLFNLRSSYEWKQVRLDLGVDNVFDRFYAMPLGGAYVGQGASMTTNGIPWGVPIPGMGRSFNLALNVRF